MSVYMHLLVLPSHRNSLTRGHGLFNTDATHRLTHTKKYLHIVPKLCIDDPCNKERFFPKHQSTAHNGDNSTS